MEALASSAEPECWLCYVGVLPSARSGDLATRLVDLRDADGYAEAAQLPIPHALAAVDSSWGAILADEAFALLGARPDVMTRLRTDHPSLDFARQQLGFEMEFADDGEWPRAIVAYITATA